MKKTIQINIGGFLFNIEEDAYERLKNYLDSIKSYFSTYGDEDDISLDIESRIAEKFLSVTDENRIINIENVESIINQMGTVQDFEALENPANSYDSPEELIIKERTAKPQEEPKRIYRDTKRKVIAGVLAGIANYFDIDVVWLRVIALTAFFSLTPLTDSAASAFVFVAYIICWIAFPPNDHLELDKNLKKFYRDADGKVIAGVCSGLSYYFGVDVALIRVIFVATGIFGAGIVAYIILWMSAPEADSITQKMEMRGEPVTLSNIETNVKKRLASNGQDSEGALSKIILFPFRVLSELFDALGRMLKQSGPVFRVIIGIIAILMGVAIFIASIAGTSAFYGFGEFFQNQSGEFYRLLSEVPSIGGIFLFFSLAIPAISLMVLGGSLLSDKALGSRSFWYTCLGLWLISIFSLGGIIGRQTLNFKNSYQYKIESKFAVPNKTLYLDVAENPDIVSTLFQPKIEIKSYSGNEILIVKEFKARGITREVALKNAKKIQYEIEQRDSVLVFNESATLEDGQPFRNQSVHVTVFIPENLKFKVSQNFTEDFSNVYFDLSRNSGVRDYELYKFNLQGGEDGEIVCLDCPKLSEEELNALSNRSSSFNTSEFETNNMERLEFNHSGFSSIQISSALNLEVIQSNEFRIEAYARNKEDLDNLAIDLANDELSINIKDKFGRHPNPTVIKVYLPIIESLEISGASRVKLVNFRQSEDFELEMTGASNGYIDINTKDIAIDLSGASQLNLIGNFEKGSLELSGASNLEAKSTYFDEISIEASGASHAELGKYRILNKELSGASDVQY